MPAVNLSFLKRAFSNYKRETPIKKKLVALWFVREQVVGAPEAMMRNGIDKTGPPDREDLSTAGPSLVEKSHLRV